MKSDDTEAKLPPFLQPFFWDTDFSVLRLPEHEFYLIERLLEYGNDEAIRWLCRTVPQERIALVVRQTRAISRNTANFWGLMLDIPREQMRCFSTPCLLEHGSFSAP